MNKKLLTISEHISDTGENIRRSVGEVGRLSMPGRNGGCRSGQKTGILIKKKGPSSNGLANVRQRKETQILCSTKVLNAKPNHPIISILKQSKKNPTPSYE